ncbi:RNA-binding protein cabeza-like [Musca domestica]|uniref:RNA-binding protein cabeza-like n=1 Tax=Musca domestica TaxID=7370 RepID=A0A1I8NJW3_MUSDO|nr:RNA-binding protein cabeza-like [Musca domestica]
MNFTYLFLVVIVFMAIFTTQIEANRRGQNGGRNKKTYAKKSNGNGGGGRGRYSGQDKRKQGRGGGGRGGSTTNELIRAGAHIGGKAVEGMGVALVQKIG